MMVFAEKYVLPWMVPLCSALLLLGCPSTSPEATPQDAGQFVPPPDIPDASTNAAQLPHEAGLTAGWRSPDGTKLTMVTLDGRYWTFDRSAWDGDPENIDGEQGIHSAWTAGYLDDLAQWQLAPRVDGKKPQDHGIRAAWPNGDNTVITFLTQGGDIYFQYDGTDWSKGRLSDLDSWTSAPALDGKKPYEAKIEAAWQNPTGDVIKFVVGLGDDFWTYNSTTATWDLGKHSTIDTWMNAPELDGKKIYELGIEVAWRDNAGQVLKLVTGSGDKYWTFNNTSATWMQGKHSDTAVWQNAPKVAPR